MRLIDDFEVRFLLGVPAMDRTHREFVELVNHLGEAGAAVFAYLYPDLVDHTHAHFANEDALMRQTGFPAIGAHRAEHTRVLEELDSFRACVGSGCIVPARAYVTEQLPAWFARHAVTMDSALAAHVKAGMRLKAPG